MEIVKNGRKVVENSFLTRRFVRCGIDDISPLLEVVTADECKVHPKIHVHFKNKAGYTATHVQCGWVGINNQSLERTASHKHEIHGMVSKT